MDAGLVTDELFWVSALVFAILDGIWVTVLAWRLPRAHFRQLLPALWIVTPLFWAGIYGWIAGTVYWEECYHFIFPPWVKGFTWIFGLAEGLLGPLFAWLALKLPLPPVVSVAAFGMLQSLPGHLNGFRLGLLTKCPMLVGTSPLPALVFGMFEFAFYWCAILSLAALVQSASRVLRPRFAPPGHAL